jgi:hypothetical protein
MLTLLQTFCTSQGVTPDTVNTWHAWKTFKAFARAAGDLPDSGVSVQLIEETDETDRLLFMRQEYADDGNELRPVGGVVWELTFDPGRGDGKELEIWSLDFRSFDDFVDAVEQNDVIAPLLSREATSGMVYWEADEEYD